MDNLLSEGRVLYTDNFYTSVKLAEHLLEKNTYFVGRCDPTGKETQKMFPTKDLSLCIGER